MKLHKWTLGLAAVGLVSLSPALQAEEASNQVMTTLSSTTLSGYVSTSAIWVPGNNDGTLRLPGRTYTNPDKADGFNLDVVSLSLSKSIEDTGTWAAGYNVQLLFGPDATGFNTSINTGGHESDFALKQANITLRAPVGNGLDITLGVFDTVIGYEVWDNPYNANFSRSYAYAIEPTQHTGVMVSYAFNDIVSAKLGVANTTHARINSRSVEHDGTYDEDQSTVLGSITITAPDSGGSLAGSSLTGAILYGQGTSRGDSETTSYYLGGTLLTPVDRLSVGAAFDYVDYQDNGGTAWTLGGYASYNPTEKLGIHARVEYATSSDAIWGGTAWSTAGNSYQYDPDYNDQYYYASANNAFDQEFLGSTLTLQYDLFQNVLLRGEVRYDVDLEDKQGGAFGTSIDPDDDSWWLALNVAYLF